MSEKSNICYRSKTNYCLYHPEKGGITSTTTEHQDVTFDTKNRGRCKKQTPPILCISPTKLRWISTNRSKWYKSHLMTDIGQSQGCLYCANQKRIRWFLLWPDLHLIAKWYKVPGHPFLVWVKKEIPQTTHPGQVRHSNYGCARFMIGFPHFSA